MVLHKMRRQREIHLDGVVYTASIAVDESGTSTAAQVGAWQKAIARQAAEAGAAGPQVQRWLRKTSNLTSAQLAHLLDVDRTTIYRWEAGILPIPRASWVALVALATHAPTRRWILAATNRSVAVEMIDAK